MNFFDWEKLYRFGCLHNLIGFRQVLVCCADSLQNKFHLLTEGGKPPSLMKSLVQVQCLIFVTLQGLSLGYPPCVTEPEVLYTAS